jgi:hypothetical protein
VLALFSAFCFFAGIWREFSPGPPPPQPDIKKLPRLLLIGVNSFLSWSRSPPFSASGSAAPAAAEVDFAALGP